MGVQNLWIFLLVSISSVIQIQAFFAVPRNTNSIFQMMKHLRLSESLPSNAMLYEGADCNRACIDGDPPRICYFKFMIEHYQTMGAACKNCSFGTHEDCLHPQCITVDGYEKGCMSINRQIPGPALEVCVNDIIVVDVHNLMEGTDISIHWHGVRHLKTPFMDGVPYVTQCPIDYGTIFRYAFKASDVGSHFYHSHSGHQKANGIYGALVIREPPSDDPNSYLYDCDLPEHVLLASDWIHDYAEMFVPGLQSRYITIEAMLINGKGRFYDEFRDYYEDSPYAVFRVRSGKKYRFRYINSGSQNCPFEFQIEKHRMTIIANDGHSVKPRTVDTLIATSGERYDFILEANQTVGNYWIRLRATGPCNIDRVETFAVLSYRDKKEISDMDLSYPKHPVPKFDDNFPPGIYMNHPNATCYQPGATYICSSDLQSYDRDEALITNPPDHQFLIKFNTYNADFDFLFSGENWVRFMNVFSTNNNIGVMNNISLTFNPFPLLTQRDEIDEDVFCHYKKRPAKCQNPSEMCFCLHRIKVKLNSIVEMVFSDESEEKRELNHPIHMHGHHFVIIGMGQRNETVGKKSFTLPNPLPPKRDTVSVPSKGYAITRFRADNPGFWLIHCHFEWHLGIGMSMILQVGEHDEMVETPPRFPKCGNYIPEVHLNDL